MSKIHTPMALALALTLGGGAAYADPAQPGGDLYREAIWSIQTSANADAGSAAGKQAIADANLYEEAVWDVHASFAPDAFATQSDRLQTARTGQSDASYAGTKVPERDRDPE